MFQYCIVPVSNNFILKTDNRVSLDKQFLNEANQTKFQIRFDCLTLLIFEVDKVPA